MCKWIFVLGELNKNYTCLQSIKEKSKKNAILIVIKKNCI